MIFAVAKAVWTLTLSAVFMFVALVDHATATVLVPVYVVALLAPVVLPWCFAQLRARPPRQLGG